MWETFGSTGFLYRFANLHTVATFTCLATGLGGSNSDRSFTMVKPTPNPPESNLENTTANPDSSLHLKAEILKKTTPHNPSKMYAIVADMDTESLLANACESLASASIMASDFATFLEGPQRSMLLGIQQIIMLADLAVNQALDNLDPIA